MSEAKHTPASYSVYHGGKLYGLGQWSGPHATIEEAEASRDECEQVVGGSPFVDRDDQRACRYCGCGPDECGDWEVTGVPAHAYTEGMVDARSDERGRSRE